MANRVRTERLEIKLTKEEKELFQTKMRQAKCKSMKALLYDSYRSFLLKSCRLIACLSNHLGLQQSFLRVLHSLLELK